MQNFDQMERINTAKRFTAAKSMLALSSFTKKPTSRVRIR